MVDKDSDQTHSLQAQPESCTGSSLRLGGDHLNINTL